METIMRFSTFLSKPFAIGSVLLGTVVIGVGSVGSLSESAIAQTQPACQPPRANQFLLLVVNSQSNAQTQLQQLLPSNAILTACDYLSRNVIRVEGFSSAEIANAWAKYVSDRTGLQAFIARPATTTAPGASAATPSSATPSSATAASTARTPVASSGASTTNGARSPASPAATASAVAYNPQPLGAGYAVLVNYADRPEVAIELSQAIAGSIGLAVYNQRPYLLAIQTADQAAATALLKTLSDRGFSAEMVDSQRVVLLTPAVAGATRR
jgi:hypothetical protein